MLSSDSKSLYLLVARLKKNTIIQFLAICMSYESVLLYAKGVFICSLFSFFVIMLSFNTGINLPLLNKAAAF